MPGIQHLLVNPFLNATLRATGRALTLGTFTDAALGRAGQSAAIVAIYDAYHPVWLAYQAAAAEHGVSRGQKVGSVYSFQELLASLSGKIKGWGLAIENVHAKGTGEYEALLPRGRKAFRDGSRTARMVAVAALEEQLRDEPALSALHTEVAAFKAALEAAMLRSEGKKGSARGSGSRLETARIALCTALYAALGALIALYPDQPHRVSAYFDVATMHRHRHRKHAPAQGESLEASAAAGAA